MRDRPTILDEISVSGGAATSRCPCGVRKRAGVTAATRTARYSVPSATRRRQSAPRINGGLFCPGARTNLARNFAVRVILVRMASMWAFRVLARVGPRGRRPPVTNNPLFQSDQRRCLFDGESGRTITGSRVHGLGFGFPG